MRTLDDILNEKWKVSDYDSPRTGKKLFADNHKKIDGHDVHIGFSGNGEKHFNVDYDVDQSYDKQSISPQTGKKVINHVGKSLHSFIRHMKPASITMASKKDRNIDLHAHLAQKIAKKYGGKVRVTPGSDTGSTLTRHTVEFDK